MTDTRFAEMLREMGLSIADFARQYQVPYRTAQNWKLGIYECPDHILIMLTKIREAEAVKVKPVDGEDVKLLKAEIRYLKAVIDRTFNSFADLGYNMTNTRAELNKQIEKYENRTK